MATRKDEGGSAGCFHTRFTFLMLQADKFIQIFPLILESPCVGKKRFKDKTMLFFVYPYCKCHGYYRLQVQIKLLLSSVAAFLLY